MKRLMLCLAGLVLATSALESTAQTCASPLPLVAVPNWPYFGDTCSASNSLPFFGAIDSPQNDIVYTYIASGSETFTIATSGGFISTDPVVLLLPQCAASADPIHFGMPGMPMATAGYTVPGQRYYVVVTADPGGPANGCGQYMMTVQ